MLNEKNESEIKEDAILYDKWIYNINELIDLVYEYKERGENYSFDFKNKKFYSLLDDVDSCYIKVTGLTKDEYIKKQERIQQRKLEEDAIEREIAIKNIPNLIEKGKKFIYPQRYKKWADCVEIRVEDIYHGKDIECAISVMSLLDKGTSFQEIYDTIKEQGHTGTSYSSLMSMITNFSKKGPEFYRFVDKEPTQATEKFLEKIENENKQFAQELKSQSQSDFV